MTNAILKKSYNLRLGEQIRGPFSQADVSRFVLGGTLSIDECFVQIDGTNDWVQLRQAVDFEIDIQMRHSLHPTASPVSLAPISIPQQPLSNVLRTQSKNSDWNRSSDKFYEDEIFPVAASGVTTFNVFAFLCFSYWFGYKGMWNSLVKWTIISALGNVVAIEVFNEQFAWFLNSGLWVLIGFRANIEYRRHYIMRISQNRSPASNSIAHGLLGVIIAFVLSVTAYLALSPDIDSDEDSQDYSETKAS